MERCVMENKVSEQAILDAIESLKAQGIKINIRSIRQEIGSGSFATISPIYKQWRDSQKSDEPIKPDLPDVLKKAALRNAELLWEAAYEQLSEAQLTQLNTLQQAYQQSEIDQEVLENELWNAQLLQNELRESLQATQRIEKDLYETIAQTKASNAELSAELRHASERSHQLEVELEKIKHKFQQQSQTLDSSRSQVNDLNEEIATMQRQMSNMDIQLAEVSSLLIVEKDQCATLAVQLTESQKEFQEQQTINQMQASQLDLTITNKNELQQKLDRAVQEIKNIKVELQQTENKLHIEQESNRIAQASIEKMWQNQMNELREQIKELTRSQVSQVKIEG